MSVLSLRAILELPPIPWVVESILPRGGVFVLGGTEKIGKSCLALDTVLRAVRHRPVFGAFAAPTVDRALIMNAEGGHQGIRMRAVMLTHLGALVLDSVDVEGDVPQITHANGSVNQAVVEELAMLWCNYDLVVVDPLVEFHTADENSNSQMGQVMAAFRRAAREANCGLIIVHHTAKPPKDALLSDLKARRGQALRGASAIRGAVDGLAVALESGPNRLALVFDLRYARSDDIDLIGDRHNLRFYQARQLSRDQVGGLPSDWALDYSTDATVANYARSFALTEGSARSLMEVKT